MRPAQWIMISGPYGAGAADAAARAANVRALNDAARFQARGLPVCRTLEEIPEAG
jgi:hypothetical protein